MTVDLYDEFFLLGVERLRLGGERHSRIDVRRSLAALLLDLKSFALEPRDDGELGERTYLDLREPHVLRTTQQIILIMS